MQRHQIYLRSYAEPHPILYKNSDSYEKSNDILLKNCNGACCFLAGMCFSPPVRGVGDGADRGSGACAEGVGRLGARILLKCFFAGLGRGVLTPSRLKPYSPYMLTHTGGEKYSEFSDSVAAAIC